MTATIFTHPPDYPAAAVAARALRAHGVRVFLAIDAKDPRLTVEGCTVVRTDFPRNGNLNGKACVLGILRTLAANADGGEWSLKVDSDALCLGNGWLAGREEAAVGLYHPGHRGFFGFCYALRTSRLPDFIAAAELLPEDENLPEDCTIGELLPDVHRYENLTAGCPFAAYPWETQKPDEHWREKYEVLVFQRVSGRDRRAVLEKMTEMIA